MGASQDLLGVVLGGAAGHAVCTSMAVAGGKQLASTFDERLISAVSGVLFIAFGLMALVAGPLL